MLSLSLHELLLIFCTFEDTRSQPRGFIVQKLNEINGSWIVNQGIIHGLCLF